MPSGAFIDQAIRKLDRQKDALLEIIKVRCGKKHFEALDVPFAVVVRAEEV